MATGKNKPVKKRHHYVPQMYLEHFCRDGGIWVHDFEEGKTFGTKPLNVTVQSYYYSIVSPDGARDNIIEDFLGDIETSVAGTLQKLRSRQLPDAEACKQLALFIALFIGRVPAFHDKVQAFYGQMLQGMARQNVAAPGAFDHLRIIRARQSNRVPRDITDEELLEWVRENGVDEAVHRNEILWSFLDIAEMAHDVFLRMRWEFCFAPPKTSFVATDVPFNLVVTDPAAVRGIYGVGLFSAAAVRLVPLTQDCCLIIRTTPNNRGEIVAKNDVAAQHVRELNLTLAYKARRFLIARDEALVRNIAGNVAPKRLARQQRAGQGQQRRRGSPERW